MPEFFWGIVLILVFARYLNWLPAAGYAPIERWRPAHGRASGPAGHADFALIAHVSRLTRSSMLEAMRSHYVRFARAKGLPERPCRARHALRNALLPTITVLAIDVGLLIGGIVVVETVFSYPGLGRLLMFAIERHDLPLIQAEHPDHRGDLLPSPIWWPISSTPSSTRRSAMAAMRSGVKALAAPRAPGCRASWWSAAPRSTLHRPAAVARAAGSRPIRSTR